MYTLHNTFVHGEPVESTHRTLGAAIKANEKKQRDIKRNNGESSYLPTVIRKDGESVPDGELEAYWNSRSY